MAEPTKEHADPITELQTQQTRFQKIYNHQRPHRALTGLTPAAAYRATPKATLRGTSTGEHFRIRLDHIDDGGKVSLRRTGRMHHFGVGAHHRGTPVLILIDATTATVTNRTTGEILSEHNIDPTRIYWRTRTKSPADGQALNDDPTHLSTITRLITVVELGDSNP